LIFNKNLCYLQNRWDCFCHLAYITCFSSLSADSCSNFAGRDLSGLKDKPEHKNLVKQRQRGTVQLGSAQDAGAPTFFNQIQANNAILHYFMVWFKRFRLSGGFFAEWWSWQ
jgi:hypothetical protein